MAMTIIEALAADRLGKPKTVSFGYYPPAIDGVRIDALPEIAAAIERAGSRVMPFEEALSALDALGSRRAPNVVVHTTRGTMTLGHKGTGWHILSPLDR